MRIAGYGPGAANVVGLTDQTDLFFTAANALELDRELDGLSAEATIEPLKEVAPGEEFTITATGLAADWQATGLLESEPVDLGQVDVLRGTAVFTAVAPDELGEHTVTITGAQTGSAPTARLVVSADPAAELPTTEESEAPAAVDGDRENGALAVTGATAPWMLAGIALAMVAVGAYAVHRRRRGLA